MRAVKPARLTMVREHLAARGISDPRVLKAFLDVPREAFVDSHLAKLAYIDEPLPIGGGQTISQPYIVALMTEALLLTGGERVLEVGTGSGYAAAILSRVAREVYTIERDGELAQKASERLARFGYRNVQVLHGDGTEGWPEHAPYEGISVTAGGRAVPPQLLAQLSPGGRLVMPVGPESTQTLTRLTRQDHGRFRREALLEVRFVPLISGAGSSAADRA